MITAVDTNVLIDVFGADATFGRASQAALAGCAAEGALVACAVVWAEIGGLFATAEGARQAMYLIGVEFDPMDQPAAFAAGAAWSHYRKHGGQRTRVIADFLLGAHAIGAADRLLTRDPRFYRSYFPKLSLVDPTRPTRPTRPTTGRK